MNVSVTLTKASRAKLRRLERKFPRTMRSAFGAAATRAQNGLRKVMRKGGGTNGVPAMAPHHYISKQLRPGQQMGGVLADRKRIVKYRLPDGGQYIGWPDDLAAWAERFQDKNTHVFTVGERRHIHFKGVREIPETYNRPERDVIESYATDLANKWPGMVLEMFDKYYRRNLAKYGSVK